IAPTRLSRDGNAYRKLSLRGTSTPKACLQTSSWFVELFKARRSIRRRASSVHRAQPASGTFLRPREPRLTKCSDRFRRDYSNWTNRVQSPIPVEARRMDRVCRVPDSHARFWGPSLPTCDAASTRQLSGVHRPSNQTSLVDCTPEVRHDNFSDSALVTIGYRFCFARRRLRTQGVTDIRAPSAGAPCCRPPQ